MSFQAAPSPKSERRRPRRIAADEAHAWARNLRLGNPYAKLVLCMLTLYVNGDGHCFVSVNQLADDCEFAVETVRRRLAWLETIGAVARLAQWVDEHGRRNSEGRGRRTSDEIRLLIDVDPDEIEARASGSDPPLPVGGQDMASDSADPPASPLPTPSLRPGAESLEPEPELEESPLPPKGGEMQQQIADQESEAKQWPHAESWSRFEDAYSDPIGRQTFARHVWAALTDDERVLATKAAKGYVAYRRSQKKPANPLNAHTFLKERDAWARYAALAPPEQKTPTPESRFVSSESQEFHARQVLDVLHGDAPRKGTLIPENGRGYMATAPELGPEFLALAHFDPFDQSQWLQLWHDDPEHKHQIGAWRERVGELSYKSVETGEFIAVLGTQYPKMKRYSLVPCEWPPRKDGTLSATGPPVAA